LNWKATLASFFRFLDGYESRFGPVNQLDEVTDAMGILWLNPLDDAWETPTQATYEQCGHILRLERRRRRVSIRELDWPDYPKPEPTDTKDVPTEPETRAARNLLKRTAWAIYARWQRADALAAEGRNFIALLQNNDKQTRTKLVASVTEADLHTTYRALITLTGDPLPSISDLNAALGYSVARPHEVVFWWRRPGVTWSEVQLGLYPSREDLQCLTQLFMSRTGWNSSTVLSLDISNPDWARRYGAPESDLWVMESWKERSKDWQQTMCKGKTSTAPYYIVSTLLKRTAALRELATRSPERAPFSGVLARSPWLAAGTSSRTGLVLVLDPIATTSGQSCYWKKIVAIYNQDTRARNAGIDQENSEINSVNKIISPSEHKPLRQQVTLIPESMVPSDWRDIFANFVFLDSRYSWVLVQWALGHKHLRTTRRYLRNKLWRRYSENKLSDLQIIMTDEIYHHGHLDAVILRAKVEMKFDPQPADLERLALHRKIVHEHELTVTGYRCPTPFDPPQEIDPGNPRDGTVRCRHGERCPGCPVAIAVDPHHMVRRLVELRLLRAEVPTTAWMESQYASDLEILEVDLRQWPQDEITARRIFWENEIASGRHQIIRFGGQN
jgi:hypothetical protein